MFDTRLNRRHVVLREKFRAQAVKKLAHFDNRAFGLTTEHLPNAGLKPSNELEPRQFIMVRMRRARVIPHIADIVKVPKSNIRNKGYSIDSTYPHWLWLAACQSDPPTMLL